MTQMYAQQLLVHAIPLRGGGQPVVRCMLRHNMIEAWEKMQNVSGKESEQVNDATCMVGDNLTSKQGVTALSKAINLVGKYWFVLSVLLLLAVSFLSLSPLEELPKVPGSDKTHHLIAYALLAFPTALRKPNGWRYIILFFAIYSGAIEVIHLM